MSRLKFSLKKMLKEVKEDDAIVQCDNRILTQQEIIAMFPKELVQKQSMIPVHRFGKKNYRCLF